MKILWVYNVCVDSAEHITTWREMYYRLRNHHEVAFIFPYEKSKDGFSDTITYVRHLSRIPYLRILTYMASSFYAFFRILRRMNPDVVILDQWSFFFSLAYVFAKRRPATILDFRTYAYNVNSDQISIHDRLTRWWTRIALNFNRHFHEGISLISMPLKESFIEELGVSLHGWSHIWPSGTDGRLFDPNRFDRVRGDRPCVFFHGGLSANRGLVEAIEAIAILRKRGVSVRLVLAGDGPLRERLAHLISKVGLQDDVTLTGYLKHSEMPSLINASDVCVLPYPALNYWEVNVPLKLYEYIAMEKPIVATPLKLFVGLAAEYKSLVLTPDHSASSIAWGIEAALKNQTTLAHAAKEARIAALKKNSWDLIASEFDRFLRSTLTRPH